MRIAMIGAGGVATRHAQTLDDFPEVTVVAVADLDPRRAATMADPVGANSYGDPERMLDAEKPDAVYICVPPFAHGAPELACTSRRIPFFVEKPLSIDIAVAEQVAAAVAQAHLITATGYHWRYADTVTEAGRLLADHPPRVVIGSWLDKVPPVPWWVRRDRSGGQVVEQLTHVLDLLRMLVGEVEQVQAFGTRMSRPEHPDGDIDDVTVATLKMAGGALGTLTASSLLRHKHRAGLEIVADGLVLELTETELTVAENGSPTSRSPGNDAKIAVDRAFIDAVAGQGDDVRAPYAEAMHTHRLGLAIAESAATGQPVALRPPRAANGAGPPVPVGR
ncbi:MAG: Gfo/Idh/MocA family oxidoreductase [Actinomycetota bacterium]|nr:Gfo/Idh/MocA family oxidoreductase [Actinomycetota bacterium]